MNDLTLLYYSSNALPENILDKFRDELIKTTNGELPIVSVTQKPTDFGQNICIGDIGQSYYNLYRQMYEGIKEVKTKYVALTEDDSLYNMEHFSWRPRNDDIILCNKNIYFLDKEFFWSKDHTGGFAFIAATALVREVLDMRFKRYPEEPMPRSYQKYQWKEIGQEETLGFRNRPIEYFETDSPLITLCYWDATSGYPKRREHNSIVEKELDIWGDAAELRKRLLS